MNRPVAAALCAALIALPFGPIYAAEREPYGIDLEGFAYPYPVKLLPLVNDGEQVRMAYMDVAPAQPNRSSGGPTRFRVVSGRVVPERAAAGDPRRLLATGITSPATAWPTSC